MKHTKNNKKKSVILLIFTFISLFFLFNFIGESNSALFGYGGGGGGGGGTPIDICPFGDKSPSFYDKKCDAKHPKSETGSTQGEDKNHKDEVKAKIEHEKYKFIIKGKLKAGRLTPKTETLFLKSTPVGKGTLTLDKNTLGAGLLTWDGKIFGPKGFTTYKEDNIFQAGANTPLFMNKSAIITLNVSAKNGTKMAIYYSQDKNTWSTITTGIVKNSTVSFSTSKLGYFKVSTSIPSKKERKIGEKTNH